MNILILGSGGREHALATCCHQSGHAVTCIPGNIATEQLSSSPSIEWKGELPSLVAIARHIEADLTIVGHESYLAEGVVDLFQEAGLPIYGPSRLAAQIESSKSWAKAFMQRWDIPTAQSEICFDTATALAVVDKFLLKSPGVAVKASGLTDGKGTYCCTSRQQAAAAIEGLIKNLNCQEAGRTILVEELLQGEEISLMALVDGDRIQILPPVRDYQRLSEYDCGPYTAGMGSAAPARLEPDLLETIRENIIRPTLRGFAVENMQYRGVLYFDLMLTDPGPYLLEYNCRFGDPEAQALLPLLDEDLPEILLNLPDRPLSFHPGATCCVVLSSAGYPASPTTGLPITGLKEAMEHPYVSAFLAGCTIRGKDLVTSDGRVLSLTAWGETFEEARARAYSAVEEIEFPGMHYRNDIAIDLCEPALCSL